MDSTPLRCLIDQIRAERGSEAVVPDFDPENGNITARYLFVLEAPGPKAMCTGRISFDNPDPTARNLRRQLGDAGISRSDIVLWNVVPWVLLEAEKARPPRKDEIEIGIRYLKLLIQALSKLECIVLVGGAARKAHIPLSSFTRARILSCHHPSGRVLNVSPHCGDENVEVFKFMWRSSNDA